ncbi:adenosylcobinamide-GDP ribazoletransferase [Sphingomonas solaris]|uniref:Adenosylcobinamide-GDP ribazoletransferase n=1 Tax=Alterirhizorhabdus solaris TaxID=2529389 RepID=A0A558R6G9_9SPHN|nr:adenosylcobinamide-GDP ribazoletransferase [Sphingomonas solaris]TVV74977.1 adenosylcobinamide-GDP ribazoletransferase [Sphingomonas solaris]
MRRLIVAIGFLTRLPVPIVVADADDFAGAIRCYPLVGLLVGAGVASAGWLGTMIDPWAGALAALAAWVAITGALHLDGLADLADGLGAAHGDRTRLLAVMADPHVGSFGVVALVLQLLAKLVLLHAVAPIGWVPLMLVPFAARIGPLAWARWLPPLKPGGLGASVAAAVRRRDLTGWALLLAAGAVAAPALLATPLLIGAIGLWLRRRLGGITGDAHGAGIELVETGLLVALATSAA